MQPFAIVRRFEPALEAAYQADLANEKVREFYVASALCALLYVCFAFIDVFTLPSNVGGARVVRCCVILATAAAFALVRLKREMFLRCYSAWICVVFFGWGAGVEALIMVSQPSDQVWTSYYVGLLLVVTALYSWTFLRPLVAATAGLAMVGSYVALALLYQHMDRGGQWVILLVHCFFLISANLAGLFSMSMRDRFARQAFVLKNALTRELRLEEEAKRQNAHLAEHDALTGLPNRVRFMRRLGELLAAREGGVAVLFVDLDGFKPINDIHGHAAGDRVLAVVADRVRGVLHGADLAARLGGDEFVIALRLGEGRQAVIIERVEAALHAAIARPIEFSGGTLHVSASIGCAACPQDGVSAEELLHRADQNMYISKRRRNGQPA